MATLNGTLKKRFNERYSQQVSKHLAAGIILEEIYMKLRLFLIKPIHAEWWLDFYNHRTSSKAKEIIESEWRVAGIADAIRMGLRVFSSIDPFKDIDPMLAESSSSSNADVSASIRNLTIDKVATGYSWEEMDRSIDDDEWDNEERERSF